LLLLLLNHILLNVRLLLLLLLSKVLLDVRLLLLILLDWWWHKWGQTFSATDLTAVLRRRAWQRLSARTQLGALGTSKGGTGLLGWSIFTASGGTGSTLTWE